MPAELTPFADLAAPGPAERLIRRRDVLKAAALLAVPGWLAACAKAAGKKTVHMFNWSNYIGKTTLSSFEEKTGVRVELDLFTSEEEMFSKLRAGVQGYDVLVGTDYMIERMKALKLIAPYPKGALRNLGNLAERFRHPPYDPDLEWTVPYLWGTTGIAYNKRHLKKAPTHWKDLWDPRYQGKIGMLDNVRDGIGCALVVLGLPTDTGEPAHLERAKALLLEQRPLLKHYSSSTYIDELASGDLWIAQAWSGDALMAARENPDIDYVIPRPGSFIWADSLCLIAGSKNQEETVRLVDHILEPEVAAEITETVRFPSPNEKAKAFVSRELLSDTRIFPDAEIEKRLRFYALLDEKKETLWNQTWQRVKLA